MGKNKSPLRKRPAAKSISEKMYHFKGGCKALVHNLSFVEFLRRKGVEEYPRNETVDSLVCFCFKTNKKAIDKLVIEFKGPDEPVIEFDEDDESIVCTSVVRMLNDIRNFVSQNEGARVSAFDLPRERSIGFFAYGPEIDKEWTISVTVLKDSDERLDDLERMLLNTSVGRGMIAESLTNKMTLAKTVASAIKGCKAFTDTEWVPEVICENGTRYILDDKSFFKIEGDSIQQFKLSDLWGGGGMMDGYTSAIRESQEEHFRNEIKKIRGEVSQLSSIASAAASNNELIKKIDELNRQLNRSDVASHYDSDAYLPRRSMDPEVEG